ncbi:TIM-barrel domain-containing protein [Algoriphagus sp. A40]|uniref:TIM-barrel domain-containing protein n=1 Tax=Algoriphagus sp. A40 TaxID=1945863 RepID=UPI000986FED9|nr:TIM-barrel domain-containing protein [Algoriphagus sp. A40]
MSFLNRKRWKKIAWIFSSTIFGLIGLAFALFFYPFWGIPFNAQRHGNPPLTPAWALECWLWEDDVNTAAYVDELLKGYAEHDIPVRTVILDSPWSYRYNDFEVDTVLYPDYENWFAQKQDQGYRIILWMTSYVNSYNKGLTLKDSPEYLEEAKSKGYLTGGGNIISWWKGKGGAIDYSNPEAMKWWRAKQDKVYELGIDGWKLDGAATYNATWIYGLPFFYVKSASGWMSTRTYMDHYYRDELEYGLSKNPEFVTLSRALDRGFHPEGFAPIQSSTVNWVGDQEHEWVSQELLAEHGEEQVDIALEGIEGFESAINSILESAKLGYNVIGSDVAGFSGKTIPPRLYIRWAQFSAFCGLFMNGGHGDRRLWLRTPEELEIIREYSWLHTELIPYMYHYVVTGHEGGALLQKPIEQGEHQYYFGEELLVAPIFRDQLDWNVSLPEGKWRYWFDDQKLIEGKSLVKGNFSLDKFPVYIKAGAIIPMNIERSYTGIGSEADKGYLTLLIYPDLDRHSFEIFREKDESTVASYEKSGDGLTVKLTGKKVPHVLRIARESAPSEVSLDGQKLVEGEGYQYDSNAGKLVIKTDSYQGGIYQIK